MFCRICLFKKINCMSIFSETVCDKGTTFVRNRISDNIETNAKTLFNENETRLLRKIVYGVLRHFQQYFSYIVQGSFIGGRNQSTRRKPPTCRKSLTNFIT